MRRALAIAALVGACLALAPRPACADAVDEAFAAGNAAAAAGHWTEAVEHYERAEDLLQGDNPVLDYDLGTAYGHIGELGRAAFHLRRTLRHAEGELAESARRNLAEVRRRAELAAAASGAQIDPAEGFSDLATAVLAGRFVAWTALLAGWGFVALWIASRFRRVAIGRGTVVGAVLVLFSIAWAIPGAMHAWVLRSEHEAPRATIVAARADAFAGPGRHREIAFTLQGSARVRVVERTPGWARIRLAGGLEGWVPDDALAEER